jgi:hypothetical protein
VKVPNLKAENPVKSRCFRVWKAETSETYADAKIIIT